MSISSAPSLAPWLFQLFYFDKCFIEGNLLIHRLSLYRQHPMCFNGFCKVRIYANSSYVFQVGKLVIELIYLSVNFIMLSSLSVLFRLVRSIQLKGVFTSSVLFSATLFAMIAATWYTSASAQVGIVLSQRGFILA